MAWVRGIHCEGEAGVGVVVICKGQNVDVPTGYGEGVKVRIHQ